MEKQKEDLTESIAANKVAMETGDRDLLNKITALTETVTSNLNKAVEANNNTNKSLENADINLKALIKDSKDTTAKLREYCNDTFTLISTTESDKAAATRLKEETNAKIERQREELSEIIKANKMQADNEFKDVDSRIKVTNEDVTRNKEKQQSDHINATKSISDLETKMMEADKNLDAKLTKHMEETQRQLNEKQDGINKNKEAHELHRKVVEEKFKEAGDKAEQNNKVTDE